MTDKEPIMIDGVDVSECIFLDIVNERLWCNNVNISIIGKSQCPYLDCFKNPDCYYKQLARKTQECEELKEKFKKFFGIDNQECWDIAFLKDENARYRKALEEIEQHCNEQNLKYDTTACEILNIINKAKDNTNE